MEQKTVEQIAEEKYPYWVKKADNNNDLAEIDRHNRNATLQRLSFIDGFNHAQQSQPMWRRINPSDNYYDKTVTDFVRTLSHPPMSGQALLSVGYTHYLTSEDLLKLPTEKK